MSEHLGMHSAFITKRLKLNFMKTANIGGIWQMCKEIRMEINIFIFCVESAVKIT